MDLEEVKILFKRNNVHIVEEKRMNNNLGYVLKTDEGCIVNIYDTGKVNCQGKNKDRVEMLLKLSTDAVKNRKVFVVYGHDVHRL